MTFVGRRDVGDDEARYVFRSPCCGTEELVQAWAVAAARTAGHIRLRCGRTGTDPLRVAGVGRVGCGKPFEVELGNEAG